MNFMPQITKPSFIQNNSPENYFTNLWWFRLFVYFESDLQDLISQHRVNCNGKADSASLPRVPRSFQWPATWIYIVNVLRRKSLLLNGEITTESQPWQYELIKQTHIDIEDTP